MHVLAQNNVWKKCGRHGNHWCFSFDYCFYKACVEQPHIKEGLKMMKIYETYVKHSCTPLTWKYALINPLGSETIT
jgi:hypothetical protein